MINEPASEQTANPEAALPPAADVLVYVQHLLGIGHLRRAATLATALTEAGLRVVFVTGGLPNPLAIPRVAKLVQLPPLRALDETFRLVDEDGKPLSDALKAERRRRLLATFHQHRPRCLLIELFPFGRRQMRFELLPLLEAAAASQPRPLILTSLRDILNAPGNAEKTRWMLETFGRFFDHAIVHGDPAVIALEESFPEAAAIAGKLSYSGYVVTQATAACADKGEGEGEVLVSAGGGAVGLPLARAALAARALSPLAARPWRLLLGQNLPEDEFQALVAAAGPGFRVERARPDFAALLARCRLSISQAGYNTVMEVLAAGKTALVVPFAGGGETEQTLRARLFAKRGLLTLLEEPDPTPEGLAQGIENALRAEKRPASEDSKPNMAGAAGSAALVRGLLAGMPFDRGAA